MKESRAMSPERLGGLVWPDLTAGLWRTIRGCGWLCATALPWIFVLLNSTLPALAAVCPSVGKPILGAEPQILIDATCEDPGFNERNFVIDKVSHATLTVKGTGQQIPYTQ